MTTKRILQATVGLYLLLTACSAQTQMPADSTGRTEPHQLAQAAVDRTDVPWQASSVEDPDHIRSF